MKDTKVFIIKEGIEDLIADMIKDGIYFFFVDQNRDGEWRIVTYTSNPKACDYIENYERPNS